MRLTTLVCGLLSLSTSVFGSAIPLSEESAATLEKRAILPVTGPSGSTISRVEIRQLKAKTAQWNIFLLAIQKMQNTAQSTKTSYYQLAGIHGVPRVNWDDVARCGACTGQVDGYCTHDSILFLGWHRAYLALFEQELIAAAKSVASTFTGTKKTTYTNAANNLRLPYWDWAAKPASGSTLPSTITAATVTVDTPSGSKSITNPLSRYAFTDTSGLVYGQYNTWKQTLRYPVSTAANSGSQQTKATQAFDNIRASMQDRLYQLFSTCDEFIEVGSDQKGQSSVQCSNSLEGLHNTIHNTAGGPKHDGIAAGHMSVLSTAAFDPIFWLHHCNVDRLFAMWQAVYPNSYGGSQVAPASTWTIAKGTTQNADSPLTPFHRDASGNFWTTNLVRNWWTFKYTYPEFANSDGSSASIKSYINKLYGPNASGTAGSSKRDASPEPQDSTTTTPAAAAATDDPTPLVANNGSLYQYVANVQTPRYALESSYTIYLFHNNPATEDPAEWVLDPNLIGPIGVLASSNMNSDLLIVNSVPLTRTLSDQVAAGALPSLAETVVVPYLKQALKWRIVGTSGSVIDPDSLDGFLVSVYASTAAPAAADDLPTWSAFIPLAAITEDKAGGATVQTIVNGTASAV